MPKKLTKSTTKRKAKISKTNGHSESTELVVPRAKTIEETAKLSDMYNPSDPDFIKNARLALGMSNKDFAERVGIDPSRTSRIARLYGLQLAQACRVSDVLNMPLEDLAEGMGVKNWEKKAISSTLVRVVGAIDDELVVRYFRTDKQPDIEAPPGAEPASAAYRFKTHGSDLEYLDGGYAFRGPRVDPSGLRFGPRLAIVVLDGESETKLRVVQPRHAKNADSAYDHLGLDGRVFEKNRGLKEFWPVIWVKP